METLKMIKYCKKKVKSFNKCFRASNFFRAFNGKFLHEAKFENSLFFLTYQIYVFVRTQLP